MYESLPAYEKRIKTFLDVEAFTRDVFTLEERSLCKLISSFKVKINEDGRVVLGALEDYLNDQYTP